MAQDDVTGSVSGSGSTGDMPIDPSRFPESAGNLRIKTAIDVFHLYGRKAILALFLFDEVTGAYIPVPKNKLREYVHSLPQNKTFGLFEAFAIVDTYLASLSRDEAKAAHQRWLERQRRVQDQNPGYKDELDLSQIPGGFRRYLND
jgi:hypothetical protein